MPMLSQAFLCHLNIHLGPMFLQTQIGVFLKPPSRDLAFANAAEDRWRRLLLFGVIKSALSKLSQIARQNFST
jgi:hypothetical protein